jgi:hypothetical protein
MSDWASSSSLSCPVVWYLAVGPHPFWESADEGTPYVGAALSAALSRAGGARGAVCAHLSRRASHQLSRRRCDQLVRVEAAVLNRPRLPAASTARTLNQYVVLRANEPLVKLVPVGLPTWVNPDVELLLRQT